MFVDPVLLYDFSCWANDRVIQGARLLREDQLNAPVREGFLSLRGLLVHMLAAEQIWLARCQGESPLHLLQAEDVPTLDALDAQWALVRADMHSFLSQVGTAESSVTYHTTRGIEHQNTLWELVAHVINHSTEHRSQGALYLAIQGIDLGNLDLIQYLRTITTR